MARPITRNVAPLTNIEAVKQSVKNIVRTNHYDRPYKAQFGGDVSAQLFENADVFTEYTITKNTPKLIEYYSIIFKRNTKE